MKVTIELKNSSKQESMPTKADIQKNIDALSRTIDGNPVAIDFMLLADTKSILEAIQQQLVKP